MSKVSQAIIDGEKIINVALYFGYQSHTVQIWKDCKGSTYKVISCNGIGGISDEEKNC